MTRIKSFIATFILFTITVPINIFCFILDKIVLRKLNQFNNFIEELFEHYHLTSVLGVIDETDSDRLKILNRCLLVIANNKANHEPLRDIVFKRGSKIYSFGEVEDTDSAYFIKTPNGVCQPLLFNSSDKLLIIAVPYDQNKETGHIMVSELLQDSRRCVLRKKLTEDGFQAIRFTKGTKNLLVDTSNSIILVIPN
jgi:hypothetical protein